MSYVAPLSIFLPTLYKLSSKSVLMQWSVSYADDQVTTTWGQVGGTLQTTSDTAKPMNVGRANETTAKAQAQAEAQSLWEGKLKRGYVQDPEAAKTGKRDAVIEGGVDVMLAHKYEDHAVKVRWPVIVQPKLDGHRCVAVIDLHEGEATLWSRTRKPIRSVPHIVRHLEHAAEHGEFAFWPGRHGHLVYLDGELYRHGDSGSTFEELSSLIRKGGPAPGHEAVEYHVYDVADANLGDFAARAEVLRRLASAFASGPIKLVESHEAESEAAMREHASKFVGAGYEGAMVRTLGVPYEPKRSRSLLKVKTFDTVDVTVTGLYEGNGKHQGTLGGFHTKDADGNDTDVGSGFSDAQREEYWRRGDKLIGERVEVRYFERTAKGALRFPTFVRFRNDL